MCGSLRAVLDNAMPDRGFHRAPPTGIDVPHFRWRGAKLRLLRRTRGVICYALLVFIELCILLSLLTLAAL